jgi:hypothetical protein
MKTSYRRISVVVASISSFLVLLLAAAAAVDESLTRITNYQQWSKMTQDLPADSIFGDTATLGG